MSEGVVHSTGYTELVQSVWSQIAICLEFEKRRVYEELRCYPTPITACDQQFNYLLEQQANVSNELRRMQQIIDETAARGDAMEVIEGFVRSSTCLDDDAKESIRSLWRKGLSQLKS